MSGSSVINGRQHVGLQKLSALAGITRLSLGPNKNYKFVYDESSGESTLVCSCVRVLESLDLSCCVGQLLLDVVRAHHSVYHTGSGCLVFVAGAWSRAALESLSRGISVSDVVSALTEGVEICLDVCRRSSVSIEGLGGDATSPGRRRKPEASRTRIKLSRHLNEASRRHRATPDVCHIADGLSHGSTESMGLVLKAFQIQTDGDSPTFDLSRVMTRVVPGLSEQQSCVLPGCVFLLSPDQTSLALSLKHQSLNVAFINGDALETFRHLGFRRPAATRLVSDRLPSDERDEWVSKVTSLLVKLQVKLLLVAGLVSETLVQRCCRCHVLVVEKVKVSVLKCFAEETGGVVVTYVTQLNQRCVGSGVTVDVWRRLNHDDDDDDDDGGERKVAAAVTVSAGTSSRLVTAVITSRVENKLQLLEDQFWSCAHRLHLALTDQRLLPGAGLAETLCVRQLQKQAEHHESGHVRADGAAVLRLMADGLIDYVSTVVSNVGDVSKLKATTSLKQLLHDGDKRLVTEKLSQLLSDTEPDNKSKRRTTSVYDNVSVKQEVWRKASDLVVLVLQTDAEIVTNTDGLKENVTLL